MSKKPRTPAASLSDSLETPGGGEVDRQRIDHLVKRFAEEECLSEVHLHLHLPNKILFEKPGRTGRSARRKEIGIEPPGFRPMETIFFPRRAVSGSPVLHLRTRRFSSARERTEYVLDLRFTAMPASRLRRPDSEKRPRLESLEEVLERLLDVAALLSPGTGENFVGATFRLPAPSWSLSRAVPTEVFRHFVEPVAAELVLQPTTYRGEIGMGVGEKVEVVMTAPQGEGAYLLGVRIHPAGEPLDILCSKCLDFLAILRHALFVQTKAQQTKLFGMEKGEPNP